MKKYIFQIIISASFIACLVAGIITADLRYQEGRAKSYKDAVNSVMTIYDERCSADRTPEFEIRNEEYCNGVRDTGLNVINSEWSIK